MSVEAKVTLREVRCSAVACQSPWPFQRAVFCSVFAAATSTPLKGVSTDGGGKKHNSIL